MPEPKSVTVNRTTPLARVETRNSIAPFAVNLIALPTRLRKICRSRTASETTSSGTPGSMTHSMRACDPTLVTIASP